MRVHYERTWRSRIWRSVLRRGVSRRAVEKVNRIDGVNDDVPHSARAPPFLSAPIVRRRLYHPLQTSRSPTCMEMHVHASFIGSSSSPRGPRALLTPARATLWRGGRCDRHQRCRRQRDRDVVIFTLGSHARALHCVPAHRYAVLDHLHVSVTEMNKLAGGTVAHLSIKILAHREGVQ